MKKKGITKLLAVMMAAAITIPGISVYAEEMPALDTVISETMSAEAEELETETAETESEETETTVPETEESETVPPTTETESAETGADKPETEAPETTAPETDIQEEEPEPESGAEEEPDWGNIFIVEEGSAFDLQEYGTGKGVLAFVHSDFAHFSSQFGWRNLFCPEFHSGVDIAAPAGTPILCAGAGKVVINDFTEVRGWEIVIDHGEIDGSRIYTRYQHMIDKSPYEVGTEVKAGQILGGVGSTGLSTGNHLHFEILKDGLKYLTNEIDPRGDEAEYYYSFLKNAGEKIDPFAALFTHIGIRKNHRLLSK